MTQVIATTDPYGNPQCPMDRVDVEREGEFCSPSCWQDFHATVHEIGEMIEMNYLDLHEQPWYGSHHG